MINLPPIDELPELPPELTDGNLVVVDEEFSTTRWDDATWILTSAFIIFTMQSGFGLLESGSVSLKNEVNIMVKNAVDVLFGGISYWMFGYGLSFGTSKGSNSFIGVGDFFVDSPQNLRMEDGDDVGHLFSHFFFHASFATTATTIVSGAMVERAKLETYIIFSFANTLVYSLPAHWMWGDKGWLRAMGVVDIAGAGAVHLVGGITGLIATLMLRPRTGRFESDKKEPTPMSSPTNAIFGMFMLWWGWLGFNCGSTYGITDTKWILAARSATATITASIAGGITGISLSYILKRRKFDVVFLINGVLGSLVAITAMCALARPWQGIIIGAIGALIACLGGPLCEKLKIDDPVGVVPVHGMASIWSLIAVGIFGEYDELSGTFIKHNGLIAGGKDGFFLLGIQILAAVCITAWTAITAYITLKLLDVTIGLRVPLHEEILGADLVEHSLNGTYDKTTSEWRDREGHLIMVVKQYENESSFELLNRINAESAGGCVRCERIGSSIRRRKRTAFGFSREDDTVSHASEASDFIPTPFNTTEHSDKDNEDDEEITPPEADTTKNTHHLPHQRHHHQWKRPHSVKSIQNKNNRHLFRKLGRTFSHGTQILESVNGSTKREGSYSLDSSPVHLPNGALSMVQVQL